MIAKSSERVTGQTDPQINQHIREQAEMRIAYYTQHPERIAERLKELDAEWDIERVLQVNSSALTITGIAMSFLRGKRWLLLSAVVQGFFMQHALQGWCPPLSVFRKLGIRTQREIEEERFALMSIRDKEKSGRESSRQKAMSK
jgi:hypothetical protein